MAANFIIRFDDLCPEMNWIVWERIEKILDKYEIKPIAAIVPLNSDPFLMVSSPRLDFWKKASEWQKKGWAIGLHGYTHVYETKNAGIIGLNSRSEFAGLPLATQKYKIDSAVEIFSKNEINIDVWVAPAHSFDANTLLALKARGVNIVSDGYFRRVVNADGITWVPQQLWRFIPKSSGVWTVCYHHNAWTESDVEKFEIDIKLYKNQIITLQQALSDGEGCAVSIGDKVQAYFWLKKLAYLRVLKNSFVGKMTYSLLYRFVKIILRK
jgi:predicted deacetylase